MIGYETFIIMIGYETEIYYAQAYLIANFVYEESCQEWTLSLTLSLSLS